MNDAFEDDDQLNPNAARQSMFARKKQQNFELFSLFFFFNTLLRSFIVAAAIGLADGYGIADHLFTQAIKYLFPNSIVRTADQYFSLTVCIQRDAKEDENFHILFIH
jgi:hypothetical protein